jgi:signal transduction histidine kinase/CheY-like chemotaxis protein
VRLRGRLTYNDPPSNLVFFEDATGGVRIENWRSVGNVAVGQTAEVVGVVGNNGYQPSITAWQVSAIPGAPASAAVRVSGNELGNPDLQYRRVAVRGVVRAADADLSGKPGMLLHMKDGDVKARIREFVGDYRSFVDAEIVVVGVLSTSRDAEGQLGEPTLWVETVDDASVEKAAPPPALIPTWTVRSLLSDRGADLPTHRVRIHGSAVAGRGGTVLGDGTGGIPLRVRSADAPLPMTEADWTGFVMEEQGRRLLTDGFPAEKAAGEGAPVTLTSVKQVHSLPVELANHAYPVSFDAVVTYADEPSRNLFLQDETDGIFANMWAVSTPLPKAGELVHVTGFSGPGQFAPVIAHPNLEPLGPGAMPAPFAGGMEELLAGEPESRWVEARGVVRSVGFESGQAVLQVGWGIHRFRVQVSGNHRLPESWVGSRIRLQGVLAARFNLKRQLLGVMIYVPSPEYLFVDSEKHQLPPLEAINTLLQISPQPAGERLSRFRGTVTLSHPTGPTWVGDSKGGVLIQNHAYASLRTGDSVEVTGFAEPGAFSPTVRDASIRVIGAARPLAPARLTPADILQEGYDSQLVQVDAFVADSGGSAAGNAVILRSGDTVFEARMDAGAMPPLQNEALLRLTGISSITVDDSHDLLAVKGFSLLLRSPADIVVLREGPWLNFDRMLRLTGILVAVALMAFAWIIVLRRRVQQQTADLRKARDTAEAASRAKSDFLATMSHEIRTPMNGVLGMTELVLDSDLSDQQREDLETARDSAHSLLTLLNDILDLSKIEAARLEIEAAPLDVRECVDETVRVLQVRAREKGIDLLSRVSDDVPPLVLGDYTRLRQVLLNLIGNAIKFTAKGWVEVVVGVEKPRPAEATEGLFIRCAVSDTGIGIPEDKQKLVFEAFRQADGTTARKYGGSGLGLAICSRLVGLMGGDIRVESKPGEGSTFSFTVRVSPVSPSTAPSGATLPGLGASDGERQEPRGLRILLADDNPVNQKLVNRLLDKCGHVVTVVNNGREAVEAARTEAFDLVLMDVEMPEVDGFEATALIRAMEQPRQRVPIIAMTAHAMSGDRQRCLDAGMDDYLSKPIARDELAAMLTKFFPASAEQPATPPSIVN